MRLSDSRISLPSAICFAALACWAEDPAGNGGIDACHLADFDFETDGEDGCEALSLLQRRAQITTRSHSSRESAVLEGVQGQQHGALFSFTDSSNLAVLADDTTPGVIDHVGPKPLSLYASKADFRAIDTHGVMSKNLPAVVATIFVAAFFVLILVLCFVGFEASKEEDVKDHTSPVDSVFESNASPPSALPVVKEIAAMESQVVLLAFSSSLACFLYGGILFGWVAINQVLIETGIYGWLCPTNDVCDRQITALNNVFNVASSLLMLCGLPAGIIVDSTSPRFLSVAAGVTTIPGLLCIAFAKVIGPAFNMLMVGSCLIAIGGMMTVYACFGQVAFLAGDKASTVQTLVGCSFAASAAVGPAIRVCVDCGVSLELVMIILAAVGVPVFALYSISWHMNHHALMELRKFQEAEIEAARADVSEDATEMRRLPLWKQLTSPEFIVATIWVVVTGLRSNLYIGTMDLVNEQIQQQIGAPSASMMIVSRINGWVIAFGFLFSPVIDWTITRFGVYNCLHISTVTTVIYSLCQLVPSVYFQIFSSAVVAVFLVQFYTYSQAYCAIVFGPVSMGIVAGAAFLFVAFCNFFLTPMVSWAVSINTFIPLNVIALAVCVALLPLVYIVQRRQKTIGVDGKMADETASPLTCLGVSNMGIGCLFRGKQTGDYLREYECIIEDWGTTYMPSFEERESVLRPIIEGSFRLHDGDSNGVLDRDEAKIFFHDLVSITSPFTHVQQQAAVNRAMEAALSQSGGAPGVMAILAEKKPALEAAIAAQMDEHRHDKAKSDDAAFRVMDANGDGNLQMEEVVHALIPGTMKNLKFSAALGFKPIDPMKL